jgi:hypothetical protein
VSCRVGKAILLVELVMVKMRNEEHCSIPGNSRPFMLSKAP